MNKSTTASDLCHLLPWDTEFFGVRVGRVLPSRLGAQQMQQVMRWADVHDIDCLYLLADSNHARTVQLAEAHRFHFVDIRLTFEKELSDEPLGTVDAAIRPANPADVPVLKAMAAGMYTDSRFYYDPHFTEAQCDALYQTWIEKSCDGYAEQVLVAARDGEPAGFITCNMQDDLTGHIGLVGLNAASQGMGFGRRLVTAALQWFARQGAERAVVVTQGRNIAAQRLYQRAGFVTQALQLWYHRWFEREAQS